MDETERGYLNYMTDENTRLRQQCAQLLAALRIIYDQTGCENYIGTTDCWNNGRVVGAEYSADAVCNGCIAKRAIAIAEAEGDTNANKKV